jgi:hypothetical protein
MASTFNELADRRASRAFPHECETFPRIRFRRVGFEEFFEAASPLMNQFFRPLVDPATVHASSAFDHSYGLRLEQFQARHAEYLLIENRRDGGTVGWIGGESQDVETFYIRTGALVPEVRSTGLGEYSVSVLVEHLESLGYVRFASQQIATNNAALIRMLRNGFFVAGISVDERLGIQVETLKLTDNQRRRLAFHLLGALPTRSPDLGSAISVKATTTEFVAGVSCAFALKYLHNHEAVLNDHTVRLRVRPHDIQLNALLRLGFEIQSFSRSTKGAWLSLERLSNERTHK